MKHVKYAALAVCMAALMALMSACSGGEQAPAATEGADGTLTGEATDALNIYMCADLLSEDAANELVGKLAEELDGVNVTLNCVVTGGGADPTMQMGGMLKLTSAVAAGEVDVVIADEANAARNARSEMFYPLSDILTDDEVDALGNLALSYSMVDDMGEPTDETTPLCGIDLSGDERFKTVFGDVPVGAFVAANSPNLENSKALMRALMANLDEAGAAQVQDSGDDSAQADLDAAAGTANAADEAGATDEADAADEADEADAADEAGAAA